MRDVVVGVIERPQSKNSDFYRELGDIFGVKLTPSNRWGGFKALRERWKAHMASSRIHGRKMRSSNKPITLRGLIGPCKWLTKPCYEIKLKSHGESEP